MKKTILFALLAISMAACKLKAEPAPASPSEEVYAPTEEHLAIGGIILGEYGYATRSKLVDKYGYPIERTDEHVIYELVDDDGYMWATGTYYFRDQKFYKVRYESSPLPEKDAKERALRKAIYTRKYKFLETINGTDTSYVSRVKYDVNGEKKPLVVISIEEQKGGHVVVATYEYIAN